jgi:uncharacterized protein with FMN-binding domain
MQKKSLLARKLLLSFGLIIVSAAYTLRQNVVAGLSTAATTTPAGPLTTPIQIVPVPVPVPKPTPVAPKPVVIPKPIPAPTPIPTPVPLPTPTPAPAPSDQYRDGSYTGDATDAFYGIVQVRAIIQNNKISDVQFLQFPNDRQTSRQISARSMPRLTQEAIAIQSANVDIVSGATQTSEAFQTSLASALAQAK